jgi:hypothetical protein
MVFQNPGLPEQSLRTPRQHRLSSRRRPFFIGTDPSVRIHRAVATFAVGNPGLGARYQAPPANLTAQRAHRPTRLYSLLKNCSVAKIEASRPESRSQNAGDPGGSPPLVEYYRGDEESGRDASIFVGLSFSTSCLPPLEGTANVARQSCFRKTLEIIRSVSDHNSIGGRPRVLQPFRPEADPLTVGPWPFF